VAPQYLSTSRATLRQTPAQIQPSLAQREFLVVDANLEALQQPLREPALLVVMQLVQPPMGSRETGNLRQVGFA